MPELLPLPIEPELGDLVVLPDVLPLPIEPDEPDEPVEPDEPDVLPLLLPVEPDELLVPPLLELEPDLLKCASHSEREIWPSLLVSTDEKLGVDELLPLELELGELELDEPPAALDGDEDDEPLADGEDEDELPLADGEAELPDDALSPAATARVDRAKSAAAVVTVTVLSI